MKNVLIIAVLVVGFLLFSYIANSKKTDETIEFDIVEESPFDGVQVYGNGEPDSWGAFAQAIKDHTEIPNRTGTAMEIYNRNVDIVRGWFKTNDIKPKGEYVLRFKDYINQYIAEGGLSYRAI